MLCSIYKGGFFNLGFWVKCILIFVIFYFRYELNGFVYFDIIKFGFGGKYVYVRLVFEVVGDLDVLVEGEGIIIICIKDVN